MEGILIVDSDETVQESSLRKYLNTECLKKGSSYDGRISSAKYLSKRKGLVPLYINPEICLIYTRNIRDWDIVLVNYCRILSIRDCGKKKVLIIFDDMTKLLINVSFNRFIKQYNIAKALHPILL